jgi:hypothetical protein
LILYTSKHGRDPGITVVFNYLNETWDLQIHYDR